MVKKKLLKTFYDLGGFVPFHRANRGNLCVLMYHRFSRAADEHKISAAEFTAHLDYLKKNHRVLSLSEAIKYLKDDERLPPNAAVITIDDGYADAYEIAFPLLKKFDLPATLYAVTDFLDGKIWLWTDLMRYVLLETKDDFVQLTFANDDKIEAQLASEVQKMETASRINSRLKKLPNEEKDLKIKEIAESLKVQIPDVPTDDFAPISWAQARAMDAGKLSVESHTVTHPILTNINENELAYELQISKTRLESQLNREVKNFCYPNGNLNAAVQTAVENAGYASAVTTNYGFNEKKTDQFALRRIDAPPLIENFAQSASGFEAFRKSLRK